MPYLAPETYGQVRSRLADTDYKEQATESSRLRNALLGQENERANALRQVYQQGQPSISQIGQYSPELAMKQSQDDFETNIQKHNFIAGVSRAVLNRLESSGLQEGTPEYMDAFNKTMDAYKPQVAQVLGKPEILNSPNDLDAVKALASWDQEQGTLKNHLQVIYDSQGKAYYVDTATGGEAQPITYSGEAIQGAQYSPEVAGSKKRAEEAQRIINVTDPEGREFPVKAGEAVNNNFGNLRVPGSKTEFQQFNTPEEGLNALDRQLGIYGSRGIDTVENLLNTYAPPNENDTQGLISTMHKRLGTKPGQKIDLNDPRQRHVIASALMLQEQPVFKGLGQTTAAKAKAESEVKVQEDLIKKQNEQKLSQTDPVKVKAKTDVDTILNELSNSYNELAKSGSITDPNKSASANVSAYLKGSAPGQLIGKAVGSKDQSIRNNILSKIPLLTQSIMKATGMTGGQLNSEMELKNFMQAVTNPQMDIESINKQLETLKQLYGTGASKAQKPGDDIESLLKMYGGE